MLELPAPKADAPWRAEVDGLAARGRVAQQIAALRRHAEALRAVNPEAAAAALFEAAAVYRNKLANLAEADKCIAEATQLGGKLPASTDT
jgi:hypothetical protein